MPTPTTDETQALTEQFTVKNRWTGNVQFTATITVTPDMLPSVKLGLAVRWARKSGADLSGAYLSGAYLSGADLSGAYLSGAYLSGAYLSGANLRGADLRDADLSGANLSDANLRGADLSGAYLSGAYLSGAYLRGANLRGADLRDADLSDANLSDANLRDADLSDANLRGANLRDADLSDAPVIPNIHQAVYAAASQPKALDMGDWHTCDTTHCRAGWVVYLAGDEGRALESKIGTPAAATLIYLASDPTLDKFPSFYCGNAEALADMKRLAEQEQSA